MGWPLFHRIFTIVVEKGGGEARLTANSNGIVNRQGEIIANREIAIQCKFLSTRTEIPGAFASSASFVRNHEAPADEAVAS